MASGILDVVLRDPGQAFDLRRCQWARHAGRRPEDHRAVRELLAFGHERTRTHDAVAPDLRAIQHHRLNADERPIANGAAVQHHHQRQGRGLACAGARRSDDQHMYIRVQHQVLPNLSLHAYTSEDGHAKKLFGRFHMIRWTVPVDDQNAKMPAFDQCTSASTPSMLQLTLGIAQLSLIEGRVARIQFSRG